MAIQMNNISVVVNNRIVAYSADSLSWRPGFGTYSIRNAVLGGGQTEQIFSIDLASKIAMVKFNMPTTAQNDGLAREWKVNENENVVELIGPTRSGFTLIFTLAAILDDPESNAATDGNIDIEFNSNPSQ